MLITFITSENPFWNTYVIINIKHILQTKDLSHIDFEALNMLSLYKYKQNWVQFLFDYVD